MCFNQTCCSSVFATRENVGFLALSYNSVCRQKPLEQQQQKEKKKRKRKKKKTFLRSEVGNPNESIVLSRDCINEEQEERRIK